MNLHSIVAGAIGAVNPMILGIIRISTGYTTLPNGKRDPTYATPRPVTVQLQSMSSSDLKHISGLNLNGELRSVYLSGELESTVRPDNKGGDLITLPDGTVWLSVYALENWNITSGWMKAVVQLQNKA